MPALGILGQMFGLTRTLLQWMRWDVPRRMTKGRPPSEQTTRD